MKITVIGTGYVGLVSGACLADVGNDVMCLDVDPAKIKILEDGGIPIHEPGLLEMVRRNVAAGRLSFTTDVEKAAQYGVVQFIAVGTPPDEDGSADLQYVLAAARNIGKYMDGYRVIVDKSTVPVGTADKVRAALADGHQPLAAMRHALAVDKASPRSGFLPALKLPTLVLHGASDPCLPLAHGQALADLIPGARLTVLDMGHLMPDELATPVGTQVASFIRGESVA